MKLNLIVPLIFTTILSLVGCSSTPPNRPEATKFEGTCNVKEITLQFLPQFSGGIQTATKVGADGKFSIDLVPGKYVFFAEPLRGKDAAFKAVSKKFQAADATNGIDVVSGKEITITIN